MNQPLTLAQRFGRPRAILDWNQTALVLIDHQREYLGSGGLPLEGIDGAVAECAELLRISRERRAPVLHVRHQAFPGAPLFDPDGDNVRFIEALAPLEGEVVVPKTLPNAFANTVLQECLERVGRRQLVLAGFMTHMCVSTTTRAAAERGYACWVVADACATRKLPLPWGETIAAADVHRTALAELNDSFATVVRGAANL